MKIKDFNHYQEEAKKTAIYPHQGSNMVYPILGLIEETGEMIEKMSHEGIYTKEDSIKEMGDVLWYLAATSEELNIKLQEVYELSLSEEIVTPDKKESQFAHLSLLTSKLAGVTKKIIRDERGLVTDEKISVILRTQAEIFNILSKLSLSFGETLETVAEVNILKLQDRMKRSVLSGSGDNR